jgi:hypothetical protein
VLICIAHLPFGLSESERCRDYDALIRIGIYFPVQPLSQAGSAKRLLLLNKLRGISPLSGKYELAQRFALPRLRSRSLRLSGRLMGSP